jgi:elongation factor G
VLDGAIAVFDAVSGVEAQSETVWRQANRYGVARVCFINKMDRVGADFWASVDSIRERLEARPVPVQIPVGQEKEFRGVIDLVRMKMYEFPEEAEGKSYLESDIPAEHLAEARIHRKKLIENAAEFDEHLLELFIEDQEPSEELLLKALRMGTVKTRSTRSCAAARSSTRASASCSTRWWTSCPARSTCRRSRASSRAPTTSSCAGAPTTSRCA